MDTDPTAAIRPRQPRPGRRLPLAGNGFALLRDPNAYLANQRRALGETFETDFFGRRVLWTFSPAGVRSLWSLPEAQASKGAADVEMLLQKVPVELFAGRRTIPHALFARDDVARYIENLQRAVTLQCDELGASGRFEAFAWARRLGHRVGLASWAGREAAEEPFLGQLIAPLDRLDSSESFVHPHKAFWTWATGKRAERRALARLEEVVAAVLRERKRRGGARDDLLAQILEAWSDTEGEVRSVGVARDIVLVHMASMSNLFAALGWTLVHLAERPALLARVRESVAAGEPALLESCTHESIRLMQRSVVLRRILQPCTLETEAGKIELAPGVFLATLMSQTNQSAAPGLDRYDPAHFDRRRFARRRGIATPELVTTFGHGAHSCPAHSFALQSIVEAVGSLATRFELTPRFRDPGPLRHQLGGVARADRPCWIDYRAR